MSVGSLQLFDQDTGFIYPSPALLNQWIVQTFKDENRSFEYVNIVFCSDEFLLNLNREYLNHDYYTDIITFQYKGEPIEGELYISLDRVKDNAAERSIKWSGELHRVIIHGILHLIGYKDHSSSEKEEMREKENHYLSQCDPDLAQLILDGF